MLGGKIDDGSDNHGKTSDLALLVEKLTSR